MKHTRCDRVALSLCLAAGLSLGLAPSRGLAKAPRAVAPRGLWNALVKAGASWKLEAEGDKGTPPHRLLVETYDARKVAGADVARLRYSNVEKGQQPEDVSRGMASMPQQLAVTDKGVWFLAKTDDDAKVAAALKKPPTHADPPVLVDGEKRKDGKQVKLKHARSGDVVCVGYVPGKGAGECTEVCFGDFCVAPEKGLMVIEGTYAPGYDFYAQPGFSW